MEGNSAGHPAQAADPLSYMSADHADVGGGHGTTLTPAGGFVTIDRHGGAPVPLVD